MQKKNILFLLDNSFTNDRRVLREAVSLTEHGFNIVLIALKSNELPSEEIISGVKVIRLFDTSIFDIKNRKAIPDFVQKIEKLGFDFQVIHANDQTMLDIGARLKKNDLSRVLIYDSHELFSCWPLNFSKFNSLSIIIKSYIIRKWEIMRERKNAKHIDYLITVNDSLADYLTRNFKLKNKALSLRNIPEKAMELKTQKSTILRDKFNIPETTNILVFIGTNIYANTLNLEQVISEVANQKNIALIFICKLNNNAKPIREMVEKNNIKNIYFHDIIPHSEITTYLSSADVGLVPTWNKKDLSYWYALDNKLFEYLHSGVPVLATKQPEYVNIVEKYDFGICVNPNEKNAYINGLKSILSNYTYFKQNISKAQENLNWEKEQVKLIEFYQSALL